MDLGIVINKRTGERWELLQVNRTSDGFLLGSARLVDDEGEPILDDGGWPIIKSLFLGQAR
jgi:hypothetical protein